MGVTLRRTGTTILVSADVSVDGTAYDNIPRRCGARRANF